MPEIAVFGGTLVFAYWFSWSARNLMGLDSFPVYAAVFTLLVCAVDDMEEALSPESAESGG